LFWGFPLNSLRWLVIRICVRSFLAWRQGRVIFLSTICYWQTIRVMKQVITKASKSKSDEAIPPRFPWIM
jgi:hypothetical protein